MLAAIVFQPLHASVLFVALAACRAEPVFERSETDVAATDTASEDVAVDDVRSDTDSAAEVDTGDAVVVSDSDAVADIVADAGTDAVTDTDADIDEDTRFTDIADVDESCPTACAVAAGLCALDGACVMACGCPSGSPCQADFTCECSAGCDERGSTSASPRLALAIGRDGHPFMARLLPADGGRGFDVQVDRFDGSTWQTQKVTVGDAEGGALSMVATAAGPLHLVYDTEAGAAYLKAEVGGGWKSGNVPQAACGQPSLRVSGADEIFLGCLDSLAGFRVYVLGVDGEWDPVGPVLTGIIDEAGLARSDWAVDPGRRAHVAFIQDNGDGVVLYVARLDNGQWQLDDGPGERFKLGIGTAHRNVAIGLDGGEHPHVLYGRWDASTSKTELVERWTDGDTWFETVVDGFTGDVTLGEFLAVVGDGTGGVMAAYARPTGLRALRLQTVAEEGPSELALTSAELVPEAVAAVRDPAGRLHVGLITASGQRILWTPAASGPP